MPDNAKNATNLDASCSRDSRKGIQRNMAAIAGKQAIAETVMVNAR